MSTIDYYDERIQSKLYHLCINGWRFRNGKLTEGEFSCHFVYFTYLLIYCSQVTSSTSADCFPSEPPVEDRTTTETGAGRYEAGRCYHAGPTVEATLFAAVERYHSGPSDAMLVAAHTGRNRVDVSPTSLDCPPPAHSAKVDITGCTYIVRNSRCHHPSGGNA